MSKKFQIGVKDLYCGLYDADENTYSEIAHIEGLKSTKLTINRGQEVFYSDDTASQVVNYLESVEVEFEVTNLTIEERAKLLGYATSKGALAITANDKAPAVGIAFRSLKSDNKSYRYFAIHNITFKDPEDELTTREDGIEETVLVMTGIATPLNDENRTVVIMADSDATNADASYLSTFLTSIPTELPAEMLTAKASK